MLIRAYLVSGEFRVHRSDCRDCTGEARRSDSSAQPEDFPSKAAVIRSLWADIIAEKTPAPTPPRTAWPPWKPGPSSCPAPAGCPVTDPAAGGPGVGSAGPATAGNSGRRAACRGRRDSTPLSPRGKPSRPGHL
jgi:hypothetical protein